MRLPRLALLTIALFLAAACGRGASPSEPVDHVTVGSISITSRPGSIILGQARGQDPGGEAQTASGP